MNIADFINELDNLYEEAASLYKKALKEIESNMGRGTAYKITEENF